MKQCVNKKVGYFVGFYPWMAEIAIDGQVLSQKS